MNQLIQKVVSAEYSWGNDRFHKKKMYVKNNFEKYNAVFFGDSKVGQGFVPQIFDSIIRASSKYDIHSFNFGVGGMEPPESYYLIENLLENDSLNLDFIFLDLADIYIINKKMLHTTRAKYWLNFNDYFFALKSFINSKRNLRKKIYAISVYSMTYTEHLFNIGFLEDYYQFKDSKAQIDNFSFNGFFSQSFTTKKESSGKRQLFLQDSVSFLKKKELVKNLDFDQNVLNKSQVLHLGRINDLIMLAESKGVKLFIVLMPNFRRRIKPIIPIFNCINSENRIEIGNPGKYPELYSQHLFYEGKHYNLNGAQTFTKMFTNKFLQKINN